MAIIKVVAGGMPKSRLSHFNFPLYSCLQSNNAKEGDCSHILLFSQFSSPKCNYLHNNYILCKVCYILTPTLIHYSSLQKMCYACAIFILALYSGHISHLKGSWWMKSIVTAELNMLNFVTSAAYLGDGALTCSLLRSVYGLIKNENCIFCSGKRVELR